MKKHFIAFTLWTPWLLSTIYHSREISAQQLLLKKVGVAENEKKGSNNLACIVIITVPTAGYNIKLDYSVQE
jgi:hypothetical protein